MLPLHSSDYPRRGTRQTAVTSRRILSTVGSGYGRTLQLDTVDPWGLGNGPRSEEIVQHDWVFPAVIPFADGAISTTQLVLVAACTRCGTIRDASFYPHEVEGDRSPIDLSGECDPQAATTRDGSRGVTER